VDAGNSVGVIEHHPDVMKSADYIIDMGPGAGDAGGYVVAAGTPEAVAEVPESITGQYLKQILAGNREEIPLVDGKPQPKLAL